MILAQELAFRGQHEEPVREKPPSVVGRDCDTAEAKGRSQGFLKS